MYNDPVTVRPQAPQEGGGEIQPHYGERRRYISLRAVLVGAAIVAALCIGIYFYAQSRSAGGPQQTTAKEAQELVKEAGELMLLPEGETPTVATVTDPTKLKDQSFFKNAVSGDKVLIYAQARKIVLYRPSQNKIIEVASLSADGT